MGTEFFKEKVKGIQASVDSIKRDPRAAVQAFRSYNNQLKVLAFNTIVVDQLNQNTLGVMPMASSLATWAISFLALASSDIAISTLLLFLPESPAAQVEINVNNDKQQVKLEEELDKASQNEMPNLDHAHSM